jgi:tRNA1Val (adenine37-N6)-methyltransferase
MAGPTRALTLDTLYDGSVTLRQPARGYRVNVDAILLAAFAADDRHARFAVDLGAGVGAVALALHHLGAASHFALVEREKALLELAAENAADAGLQAEFYIRDLARGLPSELCQRADLVIANPPFFPPGSGQKTGDAATRRARFGEIGPFLDAAAAAVSGPRTRVVFVYPARELQRFLSESKRVHLVPKRLRLVHADSGSAARVALLELRRAKPGGLIILPPLFEWDAKGVRSVELRRLLSGAR